MYVQVLEDQFPVSLADTQTVNHSVDRVLHITRVMRFGEDGDSELASAATSVARPQPKGLKARYQPFGVANGTTGNLGVDASGDNEDVEMTQAPPLPSGSADAKSDTPKAAKKRKHGDVEKATPNKEAATSTPAKKSKKARVDSSNAQAVEPLPSKAVKQTPIVPPVPPTSAKTAASLEPSQSSSTKKSKKKGPASSETKKPSKVTPVLPPVVPSMKSS